MVWAGGIAAGWGVLDFAGGTVVHINAGVAGLVCALFMGKRKGYPDRPMKPHSLTLSVVGASLLWVGWFGFNAGSELAADQTAGMAMLVTQVATAMAGLSWMACEWIKHGKPSVLGIISGAVAGLVAITPASGTCGPMGAILIGLVVGVVCFISVAYVKKMFGYDDSLDAFGVHGVGGFVGAILTGLCAATAMGGFGGIGDAGKNDIATQLWVQFKGTLLTIAWSGIGTAVILGIIKAAIGLKVSETEEEEGLDLSQHGEEAYTTGT
jgi:Amt family ammonium transporter